MHVSVMVMPSIDDHFTKEDGVNLPLQDFFNSKMSNSQYCIGKKREVSPYGIKHGVIGNFSSIFIVIHPSMCEMM